MECIFIKFRSVFDTYDFFSEVALNATCSAGQPSDQCVDLKSECTSSLRCYCQNGYFENSGHVCTISKFYRHDFQSMQSTWLNRRNVEKDCSLHTNFKPNKTKQTLPNRWNLEQDLIFHRQLYAIPGFDMFTGVSVCLCTSLFVMMFVMYQVNVLCKDSLLSHKHETENTFLLWGEYYSILMTNTSWFRKHDNIIVWRFIINLGINII